MPRLEGQKHIGAHQEPQLAVRVLLPELGQGVGGKTPAAPLQLDVQGADLVAQPQLLPRQTGHLQPLNGSGRACGQFLVGRQSRGDQQQ